MQQANLLVDLKFGLKVPPQKNGKYEVSLASANLYELNNNNLFALPGDGVKPKGAGKGGDKPKGAGKGGDQPKPKGAGGKGDGAKGKKKGKPAPKKKTK